MADAGFSPIGLALATATSVSNVFADVSRKKVVAGNDLVAATFWVRVFAALALGIALIVRVHFMHVPMPPIRDGGHLFGIGTLTASPMAVFLVYLCIDVLLIGWAQLLLMRALQVSPISMCIPFMAFTPAFLIGTTYVITGETNSWVKLLGVGLIVVGSLVMHRGLFAEGWTAPIRAIIKEKGSRYILLVAFILSVTNPVESRLKAMTDPLTAAFCYCLGLCLLFGILVFARRVKCGKVMRTAAWWAVLAGAMDALALVLQLTTYSYLPVAITVSIKRAGIVLSVFAGWLIFRERDIADKVIAAAVMLGGAVIIYLDLGAVWACGLTAVVLAGMVVALLLVPLKSFRAPKVTRFHFAKQAMSSGNALRVAFVGCGEISQYYLPVYQALDWVRVVTCIDTDAGKAAQAAAMLKGHETIATTDYQAALGENIDAVIINTPNSQHRWQAEAAIRADKHVLLQKPLAPNLGDAKAIAIAARSSRRVTGLYMSYYDQPLYYDLRDLVAQKRLGNVVHFYARFMHRHGMRWSNAALQGQRTWRGSVAETGGGCFIQLAVHYVHLIEWICGARTVRATGVTKKLHCPGLEGEDLAVALLELDSGAMITLDTAWNAVGEEFSIHGTLGSVNYRNNRTLALWSAEGAFAGRVVNYTGKQSRALDGPRGEEQEIIITPPAMGDATNPFNQHRAFLEAARDSLPAFVPISSGLHDMRVVMAVYESAKSGRAVEIKAS